MPLHYHKPFFVEGEFKIGVKDPKTVHMTIDTGSSWVWAYSEYAINKPKDISGITPRKIKKGDYKSNLSYGMGGVDGYL